MSELTIGAWIRGRRAERNETQAEAADVIGVSALTLSRWEMEQHAPNKVEHVRALARWGGVKAIELLPMIPGGQSEPPPES